jgi:Zn finger protein HypA/HybF involved in hydrogenase expression
MPWNCPTHGTAAAAFCRAARCEALTAHTASARKSVDRRLKVVCNECGKKFSTARDIPECPRCHGTDVEPRE